MTLKTLISSQVSSVFIDTDHFASMVTYFSQDKSTPRAISAVVEHEGTLLEDGERHQSEKKSLLLFVDNDATTGITSPQLGDGLRLDSDTTKKPEWDFHDIVDEDDDSFTVRFTRRLGRRAGHAQSAAL